MSFRPKIIVILGPTASGKTALAKAVAKKYHGELLTVDSRQVYRGMDIGTAKEKIGWGIDLVHPDQEYSVAEFKEYADRVIKEILERGHVPVLAGGTGLWIWAILDELPLSGVPKDDALRRSLEARPLQELVEEYARLDPEGAKKIDRKNKRRVVRALEVTRASGIPFSKLQKPGEPKYQALQIGIDLPRELLWKRIEGRARGMMDGGLEEEVRRIVRQYGVHAPGMSGIGYQEWREYFAGTITRKEVEERIVKNTKKYAKRQMTWFRRDKRIQWIKKSEDAYKVIERFL